MIGAQIAQVTVTAAIASNENTGRGVERASTQLPNAAAGKVELVLGSYALERLDFLRHRLKVVTVPDRDEGFE